MADTGPALRYEAVMYYNTGTVLSPVWGLVGPGFESVNDAKNAEIDDTAYVNDPQKVKTILAYGPEWPFDGTVIKGNTVIEAIRAIGVGLKTAADAEAEIVLFDLWDVDAVTGLVPAKKYTVTVQVDSTSGGEGAGKLKFSGSFLGKGSPVDGSWDTADNTFDEAVS